MELHIKDTLELISLHTKYCNDLTLFFQKRNYKKYRMPNFPEVISENIIRNLIESNENVICKRNRTSGDLDVDGIKIECKAFTSDGPCSFGPSEKWNRIYFLDATKYKDDFYILYRVDLKNDDQIFKNIKVNKKETFGDQILLGRRPRIQFKSLYNQIEPYTKIIFKGGLINLTI
jgi:hypothetical protein